LRERESEIEIQLAKREKAKTTKTLRMQNMRRGSRMMTETSIEMTNRVGPFGYTLAIMFVVFVILFIWWLKHVKRAEIMKKQAELEEEYG
jgi:hypothetical protein